MYKQNFKEEGRLFIEPAFLFEERGLLIYPLFCQIRGYVESEGCEGH
jgi:hypothetical protein